MNRVVVTGLGFVTCIGNDAASVEASLREGRHGLGPHPDLAREDCPARIAGILKGFDATAPDPEDWVYPARYRFRRETLRTCSPHALYAFCALQQAIEDARLTPADVADPASGLYTASGGSMSYSHRNLTRLFTQGMARCNPLGVVAGAVGTLTFNLVAHWKVRGASCGFASACASSAHALGFAFEEIAAGRQKRMLVVGAEDGDGECLLPFAAMRVLSTQTDPAKASRPFDAARDGFVGAGGAAALVLESADEAARRGAPALAELAGWGQASDGHHVAVSHPQGEGLARAMHNALGRAGCGAADVDYVNAHATSTPVGDTSELRALHTVFGPECARIGVSSTKGLHGHGISMAGALEAAVTVLCMTRGFLPASAHITQPDPAAHGIRILRTPEAASPRVALSNSSGFGGANAVLVFRRA